MNAILTLKCGCALVCGVIVNPAHLELREVWERLAVRSDRFASRPFIELCFDIALAIKRNRDDG